MVTADILFVAAEPREFAGALRFWQNIQRVDLPVHWARCAVRKGRPVLAVANGAGWERARLAAAVAESGQLCNIGFCGALDPALQIGDIVVSSAHLPVKSTLHFVTRAIASVPQIAGTAREKQLLREQGYVAVEMESGGIAKRPFHCIKSVSDLAGETFANDFGAALLPDGRISKARVFGGALKNPLRRFPELVHLARRTSLASRTLGEFLDACAF